MDKLLAMRTFVAIVDRGSLTAAARVLETSLPSVVRTLSGLEAELGVRLLNRTTRRLALTEEGREYCDRSREILARVAEAEGALRERDTEPSGRLVITAPVTFGRRHVAPLVLEFLAEHPRVSVELVLLDRVTNLTEEGIDIALRIGHLRDSSLVAVRVGETRRVVCASPEYLARHGVPDEPAALAAHRCIRFVDASPWKEWEFSVAGRVRRFPVPGSFDVNHVETALDACASGFGCGRFLAYQVHDRVLVGKLRILLAPFELPALPIHAVYPHAKHVSARVRSMLDFLVRQLKVRAREWQAEGLGATSPSRGPRLPKRRAEERAKSAGLTSGRRTRAPR